MPHQERRFARDLNSLVCGYLMSTWAYTKEELNWMWPNLTLGIVFTTGMLRRLYCRNWNTVDRQIHRMFMCLNKYTYVYIQVQTCLSSYDTCVCYVDVSLCTKTVSIHVISSHLMPSHLILSHHISSHLTSSDFIIVSCHRHFIWSSVHFI